MDAIPGVDIPAQGSFPLLGPSVWWAFGKKERDLELSEPDAVASAERLCKQLKIDPGDDAMAAVSRWAQRELFTGPDDHDDPELRRLGYNLDGWRDMLKKRAEQENYLVQQLDADPKWRRGRLRDVISAREMELELEGVLASATAAMGTSIGQLLDYDRAKLRDFGDRMPTTRVAVSVKEYYQYESRREWKPNDINDIDALAVAVPYCDAVFTDKRARAAVTGRSDLDVFGTHLPRGPEELAEWLDDLPAPGADI